MIYLCEFVFFIVSVFAAVVNPSASSRDNGCYTCRRKKPLRETKSRMGFIEEAGKRLFEEKISGNVPESLFRKTFAEKSIMRRFNKTDTLAFSLPPAGEPRNIGSAAQA